jgi:hypothetical protein
MFDRREKEQRYMTGRCEEECQMIGWREEESCTCVRRKGRGKMYDRLERRGKLYLC